MIIRIDDSVFTVDASEAYTVLRLIKKILLPKVEENSQNVDDVREQIEQLESEVENLITVNATQTDNISQLRSDVDSVVDDVNHIITDDIVELETGKLGYRKTTTNDSDFVRYASANGVETMFGQAIVDSVKPSSSSLTKIDYDDGRRVLSGTISAGSESNVSAGGYYGILLTGIQVPCYGQVCGTFMVTGNIVGYLRAYNVNGDVFLCLVDKDLSTFRTSTALGLGSNINFYVEGVYYGLD